MSDPIGDLLREFYGAFGTRDEGPPADFDVTALLGNTSPQWIDCAKPLREALKDVRMRRDFQRCRDLLDDISTSLTTDEFLRELSDVATSDTDIVQLSCGVLWFGLAASLDRRDAEGMPLLPPDSPQLPFQVKVRMTVQGSLVLRLYLALVYMREGPLNRMVHHAERARKPCAGNVMKLLNTDYVRLMRNALSHGTFSSTVAGLIFDDKGHKIIATPLFLEKLCISFMLIQLQALAAGSKGR